MAMLLLRKLHSDSHSGRLTSFCSHQQFITQPAKPSTLVSLTVAILTGMGWDLDVFFDSVVLVATLILELVTAFSGSDHTSSWTRSFWSLNGLQQVRALPSMRTLAIAGTRDERLIFPPQHVDECHSMWLRFVLRTHTMKYPSGRPMRLDLMFNAGRAGPTRGDSVLCAA